MIVIVAAAGDTSLEAEITAIEGGTQSAMRSAAWLSGPEQQHYPYARRVRHGWHMDTAGAWAYESLDDQLWEVFCQQCGDTNGPAEDQQPPARRLRGPYRSKHDAQHASNKHFAAP